MTSLYSHQDSMNDPSGEIQVDFLLPTGILIPIKCRGNQSLEEIKEKLWTQAKALPLFSNLRQQGWYTLVFVNKKAEQEECLDETLFLSEIKMYKPLFKLVEKKGNQEEKILSSRIGWLIGKQLKDFEMLRDPEVNDFRVSMIEKCEQAIQWRNGASWEEKVMYCYPPDIESSTEVPTIVQDRLSPHVSLSLDPHHTCILPWSLSSVLVLINPLTLYQP